MSEIIRKHIGSTSFDKISFVIVYGWASYAAVMEIIHYFFGGCTI